MALESRSDKELKVEFVKGKLIDEYMRRKDKKDAQQDYLTNETAMKMNYKEKEGAELRKMKCFFYKKLGYVKADCRIYKVWKEKHQERPIKYRTKVKKCMAATV